MRQGWAIDACPATYPAIGDARGERHSLVQPVKLWPIQGSELNGIAPDLPDRSGSGIPTLVRHPSLGRGEWPGRYAPRSAVSAAASASRPPSPSPALALPPQARHDGDLRLGHRQQLRDSPHQLSPKRPMTTSPEAGHRGWVGTGVDPVTSLSGIDVCRPAPGGDSIRPGAGRRCPPGGEHHQPPPANGPSASAVDHLVGTCREPGRNWGSGVSASSAGADVAAGCCP
jgi:hypothetical protein